MAKIEKPINFDARRFTARSRRWCDKDVGAFFTELSSALVAGEITAKQGAAIVHNIPTNPDESMQYIENQLKEAATV